jgi:hypothetical protein
MSSSLATIVSNLEMSPDSSDLLREAMSEMDVSDRDQAKKLIQERLREIKRLELLLEKAKADLAKLMQRNVEEMLMLEE